MQFTFGIITNGNDGFINQIINSIENQNIPNNKYEIIVVGKCGLKRNNLTIIPFDENIKPNWITKKKNLITQLAKFERIVYLHDYIMFLDGWYDGWKNFDPSWCVSMNPILNQNNTRFRDWCLFSWSLNPAVRYLDYNEISMTDQMYISGAYFLARKSFMTAFPFDEDLCWGEGEDVAHSLLVRKFWNYKLNVNSKVKMLKYKPDIIGIDKPYK